MQVNYLLLSFLCFLSPLLGFFLGNNSPEELRPYKKIIYLLRAILYIVAVAVFFYIYFGLTYAFIAGVLAFCIGTFFSRAALCFGWRWQFCFAILGVLFIFQNPAIVALIFIYGLVEGIIFRIENKKFLVRKYLLDYTGFLIISLVFPLL